MDAAIDLIAEGSPCTLASTEALPACAGLSDALVILNLHCGPQHIFNRVHPQTIQHFGLDVSGVPLADAFGGKEHVVPDYRYFDQVYYEGRTFDFLEVANRNATSYLNLHLRPLRCNDQIVGVIVLGVDVTGNVALRRQLEHEHEELKQRAAGLTQLVEARDAALHQAVQAQQKAERASAVKSQFVAHLAHEFRTPLSSIIGFSEALRDDQQLSAAESELYLERIAANARHLNQLIGERLDMARIEAGKIDIDEQPVDLPEAISEAIANVQPLAARQSQSLAFEPDERCRSLRVRSDPKRILQVLTNLLSNALKYSKLHAKVRVSLVPTNIGGQSYAEIQVIDQGLGIAAEEHDLLFKPYSQTSSHQNVESTGLGLYLARQIAQALHGDLRLTASALGSGSTFSFILPLSLALEG